MGTELWLYRYRPMRVFPTITTSAVIIAFDGSFMSVARHYGAVRLEASTSQLGGFA